MDRKIIRVAIVPQWQGAVEGWAVNFAKRKAWAVSPELDLDDLIQEAYLLFEKIKDKYRVYAHSHFMGLFKTTFRNHIYRLSNKRTNRKEAVFAGLTEDNDAYTLVETIPDTSTRDIDELRLRLMLDDVPQPLADLIGSIVFDDKQVTARVFVGGRRETTNQALSRMMEIEDMDVRGLILDFLAGEPVCLPQ